MGSVWTAWLCWMEIILGDDDFLDIGRGDWMKGIGEGVYLGDVGTCLVWGISDGE